MGFLSGFADGLGQGAEIGNAWNRQGLARERFESENQRATEQQDWAREDRENAKSKAEKARLAAENVAEGARLFGMRDSKRMTLWAYGNRLIDKDMKLQFNQDDGLDVIGADGKTMRTLSPQNMIMTLNSIAGPEAVEAGLKWLMERNQLLSQIKASGNESRTTATFQAGLDLNKDAELRKRDRDKMDKVIETTGGQVAVNPYGETVATYEPKPRTGDDRLKTLRNRIGDLDKMLPSLTTTDDDLNQTKQSKLQAALALVQAANAGQEVDPSMLKIAQERLALEQEYRRLAGGGMATGDGVEIQGQPRPQGLSQDGGMHSATLMLMKDSPLAAGTPAQAGGGQVRAPAGMTENELSLLIQRGRGIWRGKKVVYDQQANRVVFIGEK